MLACAPVLYTLAGMPRFCISSETDLITGTSGGVETDDVLGLVESIKMGEDRGMVI